MSEVIDISEAQDTPCVEWTRGPLTGRLFHQPLPFGRLGDRMEVGCDVCGVYLYTVKD